MKFCSVVLLPALKPACVSAMIFSARGFSLFSMIFSMTAWVADEADYSVVLALLQVAFLGKCDDQGLGSGVGHSPVCQILLQIVVRAVITSSSPVLTSSAGMLLTPADFPFFNNCSAATFLRRMERSSSVWGQFSTDGSPLAL